MLSFYLIGINMADLLHLTAENLSSDRLYYRRAKTGRLYSIKVEKEAMDIITKYKGKKHLLKFLDNSNYESLFSRINKNLKELGETKIVNHYGKKIKSTKYNFLSTYYARHTWATIAAYLEIPKETIAAALGHGGNDVTDIYINFDQSKIDVANRKVLDYLAQEKEK
jgi:site-specific recombinase XerD